MESVYGFSHGGFGGLQHCLNPTKTPGRVRDIWWRELWSVLGLMGQPWEKLGPLLQGSWEVRKHYGDYGYSGTQCDIRKVGITGEGVEYRD